MLGEHLFLQGWETVFVVFCGQSHKMEDKGRLGVGPGREQSRGKGPWGQGAQACRVDSGRDKAAP